MKVLVFFKYSRMRLRGSDAKMIECKKSSEILDTFLKVIAKERYFEVEVTGYLPECERPNFDDTATT